MALNLSTTGIVDGQIITAAQITQSINALTGADAYNITISGSFAMGSNTTGSGTYNRSLQSLQVINDTTIPLTNRDYNIALFNSTSSDATVLKYSGTGPSFNPVTETLKVTNLQGTASFCASSSLAQTASYINPNSIVPTKFAPSYLLVGSATYPPATPYSILGASPTNLYISASSFVGLQFTSTGVTDGQIINFNPFLEFTDITAATIAITASVNVYGIGGGTNLVSPGIPKTLDQIAPGVPSLKSFTFQYIATLGVGFPAAGWYLINVNGN
jgi:hypothetical protein